MKRDSSSTFNGGRERVPSKRAIFDPKGTWLPNYFAEEHVRERGYLTVTYGPSSWQLKTLESRARTFSSPLTAAYALQIQ